MLAHTGRKSENINNAAVLFHDIPLWQCFYLTLELQNCQFRILRNRPKTDFVQKIKGANLKYKFHIIISGRLKVFQTDKETGREFTLFLLIQNQFFDVISSSKFKEIPLLGICLGMQLFFEESEEFGKFQGLNLLRRVPYSLPEVGGWVSA